MRVFLSWSGRRSKRVAEGLRDWLPNVIQAVEPWMSAVDVDAGSRWSSEIAYALQESRFGILSLTPENLNAPWLLFEAGALSKTVTDALVCPYLVGFDAHSLRGPLSQFQAATADRTGTWQLLQAINRALLESSLPEQRLEKAFDVFWPELRSCIDDVTQGGDTDACEPNRAPVLRQPRAEGPTDAAFLEVLLQKLNASEAALASVATADREYVFLAHGRDHPRREAVARAVERLGPEVIILDQQPNKGLTVIEKLERYTEVQYAVVLMTADDVGASKSADSANEISPRARQNVLMELGYLLAKLGRSKVCVLREEGVEMPSDYAGILYITFDRAGAWQFLLARELMTAGLRVNVNNLLQGGSAGA